MRGKKRILYVMHLDWSWIKQRPQFIEEKLENKFDVHVTCIRNYRIRNYNNKNNMSVFYRVPFISRYPQLWKINQFRLKQFLYKHIKKFNPKIIYVSSPDFIEGIPLSYKGKIVYDCMDDMIAFAPMHRKENILQFEKKLVERANTVIVSSDWLKSVLSKRNPGFASKLHIIKNGFDGNIVQEEQHLHNQLYTFCYFGTISHWFNFDILVKSLADFPDIQYLLVGPVSPGTTIPKHDRIVHVPAVEHGELYEKTKHADAFIMPFKINDIVLAVDPVKLYEYINFNKNILCVEYPEVERFKPFVFFYNSYESFCNQIKKMKETTDTNYSNEDRLDFLRFNTWEQRAKEIVSLMDI